MNPARPAVPAAPRNIILVGYRGSGKTAVGRRLAQRLGWAFVDTDESIEAATGRSIRAIFEHDGEAGFRRLEAALVEELAGGAQQVVSVGGGAVLAESNRVALRGAGACLWLTAPPEELYRRLQADPRTASTRPALTVHGGLDEIRVLLSEREPLYAALAAHVLPTGGRSVEQVVDAVLNTLQLSRGLENP